MTKQGITERNMGMIYSLMDLMTEEQLERIRKFAKLRLDKE